MQSFAAIPKAANNSVEGVGFEPTRPLRTHQFSRLALSTSQPPLRRTTNYESGIRNQESREEKSRRMKNYREEGRRDREMFTPPRLSESRTSVKGRPAGTISFR